jgi:hypothetical protein
VLLVCDVGGGTTVDSPISLVLVGVLIVFLGSLRSQGYKHWWNWCSESGANGRRPGYVSSFPYSIALTHGP